MFGLLDCGRFDLFASLSRLVLPEAGKEGIRKGGTAKHPSIEKDDLLDRGNKNTESRDHAKQRGRYDLSNFSDGRVSRSSQGARAVYSGSLRALFLPRSSGSDLIGGFLCTAVRRDTL